MLTVFGLPVEDLVVGDGDLPRDAVQLEAGGHLLVPAHPGVDHGAAVTVSGQHLHTGQGQGVSDQQEYVLNDIVY